jgi:hypothetical protein
VARRPGLPRAEHNGLCRNLPLPWERPLTQYEVLAQPPGRSHKYAAKEANGMSALIDPDPVHVGACAKARRWSLCLHATLYPASDERRVRVIRKYLTSTCRAWHD